MKKTVAATVVISLLLCGAFVLMFFVNCQRFASPPEIPVHPGSNLVEEVLGGTDVYPVYEAHYTSTATPDEIVKFFVDSKAVCRRRTIDLEEKQVCSGETKPFGHYYASIDSESHEAESLTRYSINVFWTRCGEFDEFVEPYFWR